MLSYFQIRHQLFHPNLTAYGDKNDVMIVICAYQWQNKKALLEPTSAPPFAV
jgi:hypothetical protein